MIPVHGAHVDTLTIEAYAARLVDADAGAAIECHLICCESCRARIAAASEVGDLPGVESCRLQSIWDAVLEAIDAPERSLPSLLLSRICSQWHRLRQFLAHCATPAGRMMPVARRALGHRDGAVGGSDDDHGVRIDVPVRTSAVRHGGNLGTPGADGRRCASIDARHPAGGGRGCLVHRRHHAMPCWGATTR